MKMRQRKCWAVGCLLALPLMLQAQTVQPADTTKVPAMDVEVKINVKVDRAQKGVLTDEEISRAVEDGVRKALGERGIATQQADGFTPAMKATKYDTRGKGTRTLADRQAAIYNRYMDRQEQKGRRIERVSREELRAIFIPKGQWLFGGSISYNEWDGDNLNYLVLKDIDCKGHTFSASPYFGYFVANNIAVGGRFNYSRYYFDLGNFDLNLGEDFNISLEDLYLLEHNYDATAFMRTYMPLGHSKVFGFFNDVRLTYGYSKGKFTTGSGADFDGTMEHVNSIQLGFCPGLTAFATNFMAVECSVGVMGLKYKWVNQETNRVETGRNRSGNANFKINLFSMNLGITFYL